MPGRAAAWRGPACYQPSWVCHCALLVVVPRERENPPSAVVSRVWVMWHVRRELKTGLAAV